MSYVTGFLLAVPEAKKDEYRKMAEASWPSFQKFGALSMVENWEADVPEGKVTSFPMAVKREPGEKVVFSCMTWPDKETADRGYQRMMEDEHMSALEMPFDGMRMMWGGFEPLCTFGS